MTVRRQDRGHTSSDGSICGYGPIVWDGAANRWRPGDRAKFRCFGAGDKILLKWKGMPTARKKEDGDGDEAGS